MKDKKRDIFNYILEESKMEAMKVCASTLRAMENEKQEPEPDKATGFWSAFANNGNWNMGWSIAHDIRLGTGNSLFEHQMVPFFAPQDPLAANFIAFGQFMLNEDIQEGDEEEGEYKEPYPGLVSSILSYMNPNSSNITDTLDDIGHEAMNMVINSVIVRLMDSNPHNIDRLPNLFQTALKTDMGYVLLYGGDFTRVGQLLKEVESEWEELEDELGHLEVLIDCVKELKIAGNNSNYYILRRDCYLLFGLIMYLVSLIRTRLVDGGNDVDSDSSSGDLNIGIILDLVAKLLPSTIGKVKIVSDIRTILGTIFGKMKIDAHDLENPGSMVFAVIKFLATVYVDAVPLNIKLDIPQPVGDSDDVTYITVKLDLNYILRVYIQPIFKLLYNKMSNVYTKEHIALVLNDVNCSKYIPGEDTTRYALRLVTNWVKWLIDSDFNGKYSLYTDAYTIYAGFFASLFSQVPGKVCIDYDSQLATGSVDVSEHPAIELLRYILTIIAAIAGFRLIDLQPNIDITSIFDGLFKHVKNAFQNVDELTFMKTADVEKVIASVQPGEGYENVRWKVDATKEAELSITDAYLVREVDGDDETPNETYQLLYSDGNLYTNQQPQEGDIVTLVRGKSFLEQSDNYSVLFDNGNYLINADDAEGFMHIKVVDDSFEPLQAIYIDKDGETQAISINPYKCEQTVLVPFQALLNNQFEVSDDYYIDQKEWVQYSASVTLTVKHRDIGPTYYLKLVDTTAYISIIGDIAKELLQGDTSLLNLLFDGLFSHHVDYKIEKEKILNECAGILAKSKIDKIVNKNSKHEEDSDANED